MTLQLTDEDRETLAGAAGDASRLAIKVIVAMAEVAGASRLIDVTSAHIGACLYHGRAGLDFARTLVDGGGAVRVPTTLNVSSLDLLHPELFRGDPETAREARALMDAYVALGCRPTWTCAPYQLEARPGAGEHVAWAESNAIVFANSVLGARTDRYGDLFDICAALTGRVPDAGLHRDENRAATVLFRLRGLPEDLLDHDVFYPVLGHLLGARSSTAVPVIEGLPKSAGEDRLKALGAAAASSGAVAMFHAAGITPEAPSVAAACAGRPPAATIDVTPDDIRAARDSLTTSAGRELAGVSLGTPHFSVAEFAALMPLIEDLRVHPSIEFYVSTGRGVAAEIEARGWTDACAAAGIKIVTDTCTYITPIMRTRAGLVMTNSAKWAYYAPGNLGVEVAFGSLAECVESARRGSVVRDDSLWAGLG